MRPGCSQLHRNIKAVVMSRHTTKAIRVYSDAIMRVFEFISSLTRPNHSNPCHHWSTRQTDMRHALISVILTCETDEDHQKARKRMKTWRHA